MANLVLDAGGRPAPQYLNEGGTEFEYSKGKNGAIFVSLNNLDPISSTDGKSSTVLPVQLMDITGKVVDLSVLNTTNSKDVKKIIPSGSKTGTTTSSEVTIGKSTNVSIYVVGEVPLTSISEVSISGLLVDTYYNIETLDTTDTTTNMISYTTKNILPNKIKVNVTSTELVDYSVYVVVA